ncbi:hypothetical protein [Conchiformibius steedae]|uniref:hypothetical protein n=1 Tax=Conchiformibius steedae TaxID=153493 RepID=UPI0026EE3512|nr:hypothetical protein [Conchiformibius steedae]
MIIDAVISLLAIVASAIVARKIATALFEESTMLRALCTLLLLCLFIFTFHKLAGPKLMASGKSKTNIETIMLQNPAFAAIKEKDPLTFNKLRDELKELAQDDPRMRKPETRKKIQRYAVMRSQTMMLTKYLNGADDAAIAEYVRVNMNNLNEIRRKMGSEACFQAISVEKRWDPDQDLMSVISEQQIQASAEAFAKVIRSYNPERPMPKREDVEPVLRGVMEKIHHIPEPRAIYNEKDRAQFCDHTLAFLKALTDHYSPKQIADVMRFSI